MVVLPQLVLLLDGVGIFFDLFDGQFLILSHSPLALVAAILLLLLLPFLLLVLLVLLIQKIVKLVFLPPDPQMMDKQPKQNHNENAKHDVGAEQKLALIGDGH